MSIPRSPAARHALVVRARKMKRKDWHNARGVCITARRMIALSAIADGRSKSNAWALARYVIDLPFKRGATCRKCGDVHAR